MDSGDNPYLTPIADSTSDATEYLADSDPKDFPGPMTLAAIGFFFAVGVFAALICAAYDLFNQSAIFAAFLVPPLRLGWVVFTHRHMRRYQQTWSPGVRGFVLAVWVLNTLLLCLDGLLILVGATCYVALT